MTTKRVMATVEQQTRLDELLRIREQMLTDRPDRVDDSLAYARWHVDLVEMLTELLPLYGACTGMCGGHLISDWTPNDELQCRYTATQPEHGTCAWHRDQFVREAEAARVQLQGALAYQEGVRRAETLTVMGYPATGTGTGGVYLCPEVTDAVVARLWEAR